MVKDGWRRMNYRQQWLRGEGEADAAWHLALEGRRTREMTRKMMVVVVNGTRGMGVRKYIVDGWRWKKRKISEPEDTFLFLEDGS
jgi:hypothetical protein